MPPPLRCASLIPLSSTCSRHSYRASQTRSFSYTPQRDQRITRNRRKLFQWLSQTGVNFYEPAEESTNYLGAYTADGVLRRQNAGNDDKTGVESREEKSGNSAEEGNEKKRLPKETARDLRPFPMNQSFQSQPVLSEELREKIWEKIMLDGQTVRDTSSQLGVEMSRVGAVVRLMEIEKEWKRIGKPLARPYAQAVMSMLPKTTIERDSKRNPLHESINDLPVHPATGAQIFHPTSESRQFTRADAAKIFDEKLLPADDRVPHPELALMHKDFMSGITKEEVDEKQAARDLAAEKKKDYYRRKQAKKLAELKVVDRPRWEFRITPINIDDAGKDGRGPNGVGWRYGMPLMDRSRGQVKIPTRVD